MGKRVKQSEAVQENDNEPKLKESKTDEDGSDGSEVGSDDEDYIRLNVGDDIQVHVDAFIAAATSEPAVKEWMDAETWKTKTFFFHIEDHRDSETDDDIVHGAVPGSALSAKQYKILYAVQCDQQFLLLDDNCTTQQPLENQVRTWFYDPAGRGLKNLRKDWAVTRNICWRDDDGSVGSLFAYKHAAMSPFQEAIPVHFTISD